MSPKTLRKAADHLKQGDSRLAAVVERVGPCRIKFADPTFPELARAIVYQQLNGKAAASIHARFEAACGRSGVTPKSILRLDVEGLRANGISPQKASYMLDLAAHTAAKRLNFSTLPRLADEDVIAQLTQVKGVGVWTAQMFLMFRLGRPDVLPVLDLGVRKGVQKAYRLRKLPDAKRIEKIAAAWAPDRTVGSWYMWRVLELGAPKAA